jgi:outer membrane receptor protein involved in Fe transport
MRNRCPHRFVASPSSRKILLSLLIAVLMVPCMLSAQNATTGGLTGTVSDQSGAVLPNVSVTITNLATHEQRVVTTNESGRYVAAFLKPSTYVVKASSSSFQSEEVHIDVLIGQQGVADVKMVPAGSRETVIVSADTGQLVDTQSSALVTTFTEQQMQRLPAPGGDITTIAFTAPGVVVNAGGAYGNFSSDGLPGISNLFVLNGFDDQDPFLNLNNSGSSNLTLGQAEISEASVVQNGYGAQYGRAAGVVLNYTTRSGTNKFHGAANYYYNGDALNANDWFRDHEGAGKLKAVSNEWALNVGGPIIKDKLFFFADYEGLHYVLPDTGYGVFPSAASQSYALANVPADSLPLYQQAFNLYNNSPSAKGAVPVTTGNGSLQDSSGNMGCGGLAGTPTGTGGTFGVDTSCENAAIGSASNKNVEWLFTARADWNISDKQKLFGRYKMDRGSQPTYTNFVSPAFNTVSIQPSYEGQLNDTYSITPHIANQFVFAANWYTAFFGSANQAATLATFPTYLLFYDGAINSGATFGSLGTPYYFPQGRNVTQYQFVDDLSWLKGNHNFKFGYDFRRDDVSDYDAQELENGAYLFFSLADYASGQVSGVGSEYLQNFSTQSTAYLALYNVGMYGQDEWQLNPRLKLTLGVRFDRTGNPLCNNNCFAQYGSSSLQNGASLDTPYNQIVSANNAHPFPGIEKVVTQPRFGFNYDVSGDGKLVVRGGAGIFSDLWPATRLDGFVQNFPQLYGATVLSGHIAPAGSTSSAPYFAGQSFNLLEKGFSTGQNATQIASALNTIGVPFSAPNIQLSPHNWRGPKYAEWNLQIQKQFTNSDAVIVGYAANAGYDEIIYNKQANGASPTGYAGLPTTQPDPRFFQATQFLNEGNSNYHGVTVTYKHIDRHGFSADVNYTYSHSLDDVSNGGVGEDYNSLSILGQIDPFNIARLNYSNSDYDIRNSLTADYVYEMPHFQRFGKIADTAIGGWVFSGKTYWRGGQPFSVVDSGIANSATGATAGGQFLAALVPGASVRRNCQGNGLTTPCFTNSDFTENPYGNIRRNAFTGPHYSDSDLALSKKFVNTERFNVQIGTYAFNIFNHPNFGFPANDVNAGSVGASGSILAPPTSPYGSFQSAGVGGRVLQVFGKISF